MNTCVGGIRFKGCDWDLMCVYLFAKPFTNRTAYHAYTSCIFLTLCLAEIDPFWTRTREGRLVRSVPVRATQPIESIATMSDNLDLEAFRKQLKEEITASTKDLIREVMGEILQTARGKQPIDLDEGEAAMGKPRDRDEDLETVLAEPTR